MVCTSRLCYIDGFILKGHFNIHLKILTNILFLITFNDLSISNEPELKVPIRNVLLGTVITDVREYSNYL